MTTKKRLLAMALSGALVVGCVAGCGSSSSDSSSTAAAGSGSTAAAGSAAGATAANGDKGTITVITKALNSDYWHMVQAGAILAGEEVGYTINVLGPNDETNTQEEMNEILDAVSTGTDGLVIAPNDPNSLASTISDAHSSGIPVIIIDSQCPDENAFDAFAGTDNYTAAEALGEYIGENQKDAQCAIIRGQSGSNTHDDRTSGLQDGLEKSGATCIDAQPADSDQAKAVTVAENLIQANPDMTAIACTSDDMAMGAYQAVSSSNLQDQIKVYAFDGSMNGLQSMINGEITADCAQKPISMGYDGIQLCVKVINGETVDKQNDTGYEIIDQAGAQAYYDDVISQLKEAGFDY